MNYAGSVNFVMSGLRRSRTACAPARLSAACQDRGTYMRYTTLGSSGERGARWPLSASVMVWGWGLLISHPVHVLFIPVVPTNAISVFIQFRALPVVFIRRIYFTFLDGLAATGCRKTGIVGRVAVVVFYRVRGFHLILRFLGFSFSRSHTYNITYMAMNVNGFLHLISLKLRLISVNICARLCKLTWSMGASLRLSHKQQPTTAWRAVCSTASPKLPNGNFAMLIRCPK